MADAFDAVVVGAGPNGLAAAIVLARNGLSVLLLEAKETIGGGTRTRELTLPGFRHDVCSAIHPLALVSPLFRTLPLAEHGVEWRYSDIAIAHPLDDGTAGSLAQSMDATTDQLGHDGASYRALMQPLAQHSDALFGEILGPIPLVPKHPLLLARFGLNAARSAMSVAARFDTDRARALFGGCAAHSFVPLEWAGSAAFGLVLALAGHAVGWPAARGGSEAISRGLASYLTSLGGEIRTSSPVRSMNDVPACRAVIFDVTPRQLDTIAGEALPAVYRRRLRRFRRSTDKPFVLVAQQSLVDDTRAPAGKHTGWGYCHVPHGSTEDMTEAMEQQIERFAPGFRDRILARSTMSSADYESYDANLVGGDIAGGANNLAQTLMRPFLRIDPYSTPNPRIFIGSSSTPPGAGVHGMCGYWAARSALRNVFGKRVSV